MKVPCCASCNNQASKDDEYFRTALSLKDDAYDHPDVQANLPSVLRSFQKPRKVTFARAFFSQVRMFEARTPAGLVLGSRAGFIADLTRLDRVAARIARGLMFKHFRINNPRAFEVRAWSEDGLRQLDAEITRHLQQDIVAPLLGQPPRTIGRDVFTYRFAHDPTNQLVSAWLFEFYGRIRFLCLTIPPQFATPL